VFDFLGGWIYTGKLCMKRLIKWGDYALNEAQILNFKGDKNFILQFIKSIKKGETGLVKAFNSTIYGIIRNSGVGKPVMNSANAIGFSEENKANWRKALTGPPFVTDGVWGQMDINKGLEKKEGDKTYNIYLTLEKTRENIMNFAAGFSSLNKKLYDFSTLNKTPISWKTHTNLDYLTADNDSFKLYYYDRDLKEEIMGLIQEWLKKNGIRTGKRTHVHGVDTDLGKGKQSYGQILSDRITEEFIKVIEKNGEKYTDEQYYQWLGKYVPEMLKQMSGEK
jgi:hypothetical protein